MQAIELVQPGHHRPRCRRRPGPSPAPATRQGVVVLTCGTWSNVIRLLPPLTIGDALLAEGLDVLGGGGPLRARRRLATGLSARPADRRTQLHHGRGQGTPLLGRHLARSSREGLHADVVGAGVEVGPDAVEDGCSSPHATMASTTRSLPPSAKSSSAKPRRRKLFW